MKRWMKEMLNDYRRQYPEMGQGFLWQFAHGHITDDEFLVCMGKEIRRVKMQRADKMWEENLNEV